MKLCAWFKKQLFGNALDELQQQKADQIGHRGFWLAWGLLLIAIIVQGIGGEEFAQMAGEWVIFMILCFYGLVEWIRNGIWTIADTKPSLRKNIAWSTLAAVAIFLYTLAAFGPAEWDTIDPWLSGLVTAALTFALCLGLLQLGAYFYYKRRRTLDNPEDDPEDDPDDDSGAPNP